MQGLSPEIKNLKDWQQLLADPEKHWRKGYSAYELANSWIDSKSFPKAVEKVFIDSGFDEFIDLKIDIAYPERKTYLNDSGRPSQTDLMIFATGRRGKVIIAVEGKVDEPFGDLVQKWYDNTKPKETRLHFLCSELGFSPKEVKNVRYQLLHRSVAAILEAEKLNAKVSLMLVHSFSEGNSSFNNYQDFLKLFNFSDTKINKIYGPIHLKKVDLFIGWIKDRKQNSSDTLLNY